MPPIKIADLAQSRDLDRQAMSAVRGGFANTSIVNHLNLGVGVSNTLVMPIHVLNGSYVGAPVTTDLRLSPQLSSYIDW